MKRNILWIASVATVLAACSADESSAPAEGSPIEFRAYVSSYGADTRVTGEVTPPNFPSFSVTAFPDNGDLPLFGGPKTFSRYGQTPNFVCAGETLTWPHENPTLTFWGWTPAGISDVKANSNSLTIPGYSPATNISEQEELLVAYATGNRSDTHPVTLQFAHALSQIVVSAKGPSTYKIKGVRIANVRQTGTLTVTPGPSLRLDWTPTNAGTDYTQEFAEPVELTEDAQPILNTFLIPQDFASIFYLSVLIQTGDDATQEWKGVPGATRALNAGTKYNYILDWTSSDPDSDSDPNSDPDPAPAPGAPRVATPSSGAPRAVAPAPKVTTTTEIIGATPARR